MIDNEILDAIDSQNKVIGQITKEEAYRNKVSHRIVHVMVCSGDKILITQRSLNVRYLPGFYCTSAGGHVRSGETSMQGALRELHEEIGLDGPLQLIREMMFEHEFLVHTSVFLKFYDPEKDKLSLNHEEVSSGSFYRLEEIEQLDQTQFHPQLRFCVDLMKGLL